MSLTGKFTAAMLALAAMLSASNVHAAPQFIDWTSFTASSASGEGDGSAIGVLNFGGDIVNVSYAGDVYSGGGLTTTTSDDAPYYGNGNYDPSIALTDNISNDGGADKIHTLTFDRAVTNPRFHVASMGNPGLTVEWVFNEDFTVASGSVIRSDAKTLSGREDNGTIKFTGDFTVISWKTPVFENTTGFQFSVDAIAAPEPASLLLLAAGLLAVRRRRNATK